MPGKNAETSYAGRLAQERRHYDGVAVFDDLPPIYHYWSETFVRPMLEKLGCSHPQDFLARYLIESAKRCGSESPRFLSVGSGDCNNEIAIAHMLRDRGVTSFAIDCLEMNPALIGRAREAAKSAGVLAHLRFVKQDFNAWRPARGAYHGVMANQSLHHVTNLEGLFDAIRDALAPSALFVVSDIVGRNGHQRWPEAKHFVERFWQELPAEYRFHQQLQRHEEQFEDWDCSYEGFEGVRAQDILPLLLERFAFHVFVGFGNLIDPFVDRGFGPHFDANARWDRSFIARVHECDERLLTDGFLTPTHMLTVMGREATSEPYYARGLTPEMSVRPADRVVSAQAIDREADVVEEFFKLRLPLRGPVQLVEVSGWYEDDWAGEALQLSVLVRAEIRSVWVTVFVPDAMPASERIALEINGRELASAPAKGHVTLACSVVLEAGSAPRIRVSSTATINLRTTTGGEDVRDLGFHITSISFERTDGP